MLTTELHKFHQHVSCYCSVVKLCLTLSPPHEPMSTPGSSVHGISQAKILEWVAISFSKGSSQPRVQTCVTCIGWRISLPPSHQGSPVRHYTGFKKKKIKKKKLLAFTCYSVVLLSVVEQSEYLYIYHLFVTIEHWVEFPVLYSRTFSLVIYFIPSSVFMSIPISKFIPLSLPPLVSVHLFSTSVSISALQIGSSVPFF